MATIIKSIGSAAGRDFATIQAWVNSIPIDLVADGNAYVGELYNDSEFSTLTTGKVSISGQTTDATHNITLRCAAGHSFRHHPNRANNPLWYNQAYGVGISGPGSNVSGTQVIFVSTPYTVIDGLQVMTTGANQGYPLTAVGTGIVVKNCILIGSAAEPPTYAHTVINGGALIYNCLLACNVTSRSSALSLSTGTAINCTVVRPTTFTSAYSDGILQNYGTNLVKNCAIFGFPTGAGNSQNSFQSGTDYNATDRASGLAPGGTNATHNLTSVVYADQFVNTVSDFRLKAGNALQDKGVNLAVTYAAEDILATTRQSLWDIGAYEMPIPATALTLSGPTLGQNQQPSTNFTVSANGSLATTVTVTPNDGGAGGAFTPTSVQLSGSSPGATFTYTPSVVGNSAISITSDTAGLTLPASITYQSATAATQVTITAPTIARAGTQSPNFTVAINGIVSSMVKVTPNDNGDGGSFNPPFVNLDNNTTSATFAYIGVSGGVKSINVTNNGGLANPAAVTITEKPPIVAVPTPSTANLIVKSIGTGKDFPTIKAFADYARAVDLTAGQTSILGEVYENVSWSSTTDLYATNATSQYQVILQAVPGMSVNDLNHGDPVDYGTEGIELTIGAGGRVGYGAIVQGFRINITGSTSGWAISGIGTNTGPQGLIRRNRIKSTSTNGYALVVSEFACPGMLSDNLIILEDNSTADFVVGSGTVTAIRNTFVRRGNATGKPINCSNSQGLMKNHVYRNNVFVNCGDTPVGNVASLTAANFINNYTSVQPATANAGLVYGEVSTLVRNAVSDFRPNDSGVLIGTASQDAIDKVDLLGIARGGQPDVGAIQGSIVNTLPKVTVNSQTVNAQKIVISGTTTYAPTTGTATLLPSATNPNGATQQGPINVTLGDGTFTVQFDNVPPGNYQIPVITTVNSAGYNRIQTGGVAISIIPITASIVAGEAAASLGNAPTMSIDQKGFDNSTFSVSGAVDTQGDVNCTVNVYVDPQPSGTSLGPFKANIIGKKWAVQLPNLLAGSFKVRVVGVANSQPAVTVTSPTYKVISVKAQITLPTGP